MLTCKYMYSLYIYFLFRIFLSQKTRWDRKRLPSVHVKYVVQTVSFRLWYDPIPGISNLDLYNLGTLFHSDFPFFGIPKNVFRVFEYFESLCQKWLNEFFQNISTFKSPLFWLFKKQSLQYDRVQCNIAELCVQIIENNMIILCYVHQLDSPRTVITNFKKRTTEDCAYFMRCHVL